MEAWVFSLNPIPPSSPQAGFCTPSTPDRFLYFDTEPFYPYSGDYLQPESNPGTLLRRQNRKLAHPWAKDSRRCALRFLTVYGLGQEPLTIDLLASPIPPEVMEAFGSCTLVGHNLDFDITVLRRHGITCSNSIVDTMLASRLLGLGKEKFKVSSAPDDDVDVEEAAVNPTDHDLATVVRCYLGIKMGKAQTKLGGSDWGRLDLSPPHYHYMKEDVLHLPALWEALQVELRGARLDDVFRERKQFAVHLNVIKMTGSPVDHLRIESDRQDVIGQKGGIREELRKMFADYSHPIPKSRIKPIVKMENGKMKRTPGPTHEEFSPSNRNHWIPALALHGVYVAGYLG